MPDLTPGVPSALSPLVRRIVAPNPGPLTGPGTNTYLVGIDEVAVIDPGPDDEGHVDAIVGAAAPHEVRLILLTHAHPDHAPAAPRLKERTGADVVGVRRRGDDIPIDRAVKDGDIVQGTEFGLDVLHTPGHSPDHLCFLLEEERMLFTGDTVLEGTTSVIAPRNGGDMAAYLATLERLAQLPRIARIAPGHGDVIEDPRATLEQYLAHRYEREASILDVLAGGDRTIPALVDTVYEEDELPEVLRPWAETQVHAHLLKLREEGRVEGRDVRSSWRRSA